MNSSYFNLCIYEFQFFPDTVKFCGVLYTDKGSRDYERDLKRTVSLKPSILISWHEVGRTESCELEYKVGTFEQPRIPGNLSKLRWTQCYWATYETAAPNLTRFKGYQSEYRISPDLGYYVGCQKGISYYISQLATRRTSAWNVSSENCPLRSLPKTYEVLLILMKGCKNWCPT